MNHKACMFADCVRNQSQYQGQANSFLKGRVKRIMTRMNFSSETIRLPPAYYSLISVCFTLLTVPAMSAGQIQVPAAGTCYYVSSTGGNDQADGRTPQAAWRSLARVNAATLQPGDSVLFRRGELWRGQLIPHSGAAGQPVTYGAYGDGAKPILQGSVAKDKPEAWVQAGTNLWTTRPPVFTDGMLRTDLSHAKWSLHTESGAVARLTGPEGTPPTYRLECTAAGRRSNHIQLFTAPLAVNAGEKLAFHFRARSSVPITFPAAGLITSGSPWSACGHDAGAAPTVGTDWADFTIYFQVDRTATDGRINFSLGAGLPTGITLWFQPGAVHQAFGSAEEPLDADVGNIIFDHGKSCGVKKWRREDLRQNGDYWYEAPARKVWLYSEASPTTLHSSIELALRKHIVDEGGRKYVTYEQLHLRYGAAHGIGGGNTEHITVRRCDIAFIGGGHQFTTPQGKPVRFGNGIEFWDAGRHNLVEGCRLWEIYDAALTNQGSNPRSTQEDICYRDNVIWNAEYSFEYWNRPAAAHTQNILFEHNTCVDAGYGWGHNQRPDKNGRHLMFYHNTAATEHFVVRNNIFYNSTDSNLRMENDWCAGLIMDNNLWLQKSGPLFCFMHHDFMPGQLEDYRKASGFDHHSVVAEPCFRNAAQHDYRLAAGSPSLNWTTDGQPCGARESSNEK